MFFFRVAYLPHIGICHLKLVSQDSSTGTLSADIIFISQVPTLTSPVMIMDFFPDMTQFLEKSKNISCDVTVGTKKLKLYVQIECQLGYLMMLISNGICQYEGRYATLNKIYVIFWDTALWIFSPGSRIFFQNSRIRVNRL